MSFIEPIGRILVSDLSYTENTESKILFETFYESRFVEVEFEGKKKEDIYRDHREYSEELWSLLRKKIFELEESKCGGLLVSFIQKLC